jgi:hypothetical protein
VTRIRDGLRDAVYEPVAGERYDQILIEDFPEHVFREILNRHDPDDEDGRSQVVQIRLPNGDLFLGYAPQGDTYMELEKYYL